MKNFIVAIYLLKSFIGIILLMTCFISLQARKINTYSSISEKKTGKNTQTEANNQILDNSAKRQIRLVDVILKPENPNSTTKSGLDTKSSVDRSNQVHQCPSKDNTSKSNNTNQVGRRNFKGAYK